MKRNEKHSHHQAGKKNPRTIAIVSNSEPGKYYSILAFIVLISFIVYIPVLDNGFLWDDNHYILSNPLIYSINLNEIFSKYVEGNYHPLTILTLAAEYKFFGLNEAGYHAVNLIFHLLNVILVFHTVFLFSNKAAVALVASLFFGIHPMHVESVAWVAELKDLLYTFFFLASLIFYLKYCKAEQKKYYVYALILFSLSLLSKAMAASLPVIMLLIDYLQKRKINTKTMLEKVPFLLLALALGIVAIFAQQSSGAIEELTLLSFPQRIVFACYSFITYLIKLFLPLHLSAYYPYPVAKGEDIPFYYYAYILFFVILAAAILYTLRFSKKIFFGIGFFTVTVFLVLQLLPVGGAAMADRYSYIPSIGIFYLAGEGFILLWSKKQKILSIFLLSLFTVFFSVSTFTRSAIWKSSLILWNDVISQYQTIPYAYYNRGVDFMNEKRDEEALKDYNKAIELKPDYIQAYNNRGTLFLKEYKFIQALDDFSKAIEMNKYYINAYYNRGNAFMSLKKNDEAIKDYSKVIELNPLHVEAYVNRGILLMNLNKNDEALIDFNKAIEINPGFSLAYHNRGVAFYNEKKYEEAISNYSKAIALKEDYAQAYYSRGLAEYYSGKKNTACLDLKQAARFGFQVPSEPLLQICN